MKQLLSVLVCIWLVSSVVGGQPLVHVHPVGSRVTYHCSCPELKRCDGIQWSLNGTVLDESLNYVERTEFIATARTGSLRLQHVSPELNGSTVQCRAIYLTDGMQQLGPQIRNVTTLYVEDVPASPVLSINSTLEDDYVISWSPIITADPNHYYSVMTPVGIFNTTETEFRVAKSNCSAASIACGDCVFGVRGVTVVGEGPWTNVSLLSERTGHVVSLEIAGEGSGAYQTISGRVEPAICTVNVSVRSGDTGEQLLVKDLGLTASEDHSHGLVTFSVSRGHRYEVTLSLTNSAGTAQYTGELVHMETTTTKVDDVKIEGISGGNLQLSNSRILSAAIVMAILYQ